MFKVWLPTHKGEVVKTHILIAAMASRSCLMVLNQQMLERQRLKTKKIKKGGSVGVSVGKGVVCKLEHLAQKGFRGAWDCLTRLHNSPYHNSYGRIWPLKSLGSTAYLATLGLNIKLKQMIPNCAKKSTVDTVSNKFIETAVKARDAIHVAWKQIFRAGAQKL